MVDSGNPLLDDDDEEYDGELSSSSLESFELPSEIPSLAGAVSSEPISDESELPDLTTMLGAIDLGSDHLTSGSHDQYSGDAFDMDDSVPSSIREEFQDDVYEDDSLGILASDSLDDVLGTMLGDELDEDPFESEADSYSAGPSSLSDFITPSSNEDSMDFTGAQLDIDAVISMAIDMGASDIHVNPFDEVSFTILGAIHRISEFGVVDPNMTTRLQLTIISHVLEQSFVEELELDTSYVVKSGKYKGRRLRLSVGKTEGNIFLVFRVIAAVMPTPDELNIPQAMRNWVNLPNGLVLVNGPTGSGKSTTLSSLIQEIQFTRAEKVITIEKPIEYVYGVKPGAKALITQREVGKDARAFSSALDSAMRQAPNIILVGEVRNRLEIDELLRAAETGHLAISTMHTTSCAATINRIRSMYQGDEQLRVLATLSDNLRGMMTQVLVKSPDGKSRVAVREVLQIDKELIGYVLAGDVQKIREYQENRGITMEHELVKAYRAGVASLESARSKAPNPLFFDELLDD